MHYINIIDCTRPDDFFMFMSDRIKPFNIQRNNEWTLCKVNDIDLPVSLLSEYLSEYIWEISLPKYCSKILNSYTNIQHNQKKDLISSVINIASGMKEKTYDIVKERIEDYFNSEYTFLTIDGFFRFRLKGLIDDIRTLINLSVYENNIEEEYNEFIRFMKEIVSEKTPVFEEIFLFENSNGFKILTSSGVDITDSYQDDTSEKTVHDYNYFDSIISSIISIAPKKIYLHCSETMFVSNFCELIKGIFAGKVIKC